VVVETLQGSAAKKKGASDDDGNEEEGGDDGEDADCNKSRFVREGRRVGMRAFS